MIGATVVGATVVAERFGTGAVMIRSQAKTVVRKNGALLLTSVQRHASGRPGPNAVTGDYRRSWSMRASSGVGTESAAVGTNAVQGRRLELGFVGVDSIGRHYNQPPYPHVGPAVQEVEPQFIGDLGKLVHAL